MIVIHDIWSCFYLVGIAFLGLCCSLCILRNCGEYGLLGIDCFCGSLGHREDRHGLGEKAERHFRKGLRGFGPHQEAGSSGSWNYNGKRGPYKQIAVRLRII